MEESYGYLHDSTAEVEVPKEKIKQVIGQDEAVEKLILAVKRRRNAFLTGDAGTGKSMAADASVSLMDLKGRLYDTIGMYNAWDPTRPKIQTVTAGHGHLIREEMIRRQVRGRGKIMNNIDIAAAVAPVAIGAYYLWMGNPLGLFGFFGGGYLGRYVAERTGKIQYMGKKKLDYEKVIKVLVDNSEFQKNGKLPFIYVAPGASISNIAGDIKHDPYQSGGLETPVHLRVELGAVHKGTHGYVYMDELGTLDQETQEILKTAMERKKLAVVGRHRGASSALEETEEIPCDFTLIAAGTEDTVAKIHTAIWSRIDVKIPFKSYMEDNRENKLAYERFAAQEVLNSIKDEKEIPHLSKEAVVLMMEQGKRRALLDGYPNSLSLRLRDFRSWVRVAGDLAYIRNKKLVEKQEMVDALRYTPKTILEEKIRDQVAIMRKYSRKPLNTGYKVGTVNGLAVLSDPVTKEALDIGIVSPIHVAITPYYGEGERVKIVPTELDNSGKAAVVVFETIMDRYCKGFLKDKMITIQYENQWHAIGGSSGTVAETLGGLSAASGIGVRQDTSMTGALNIDEYVKHIGGTFVKINASLADDIYRVMIPGENYRVEFKPDEELRNLYERNKMEVIPDVNMLDDVLYHGLYFGDAKIREPEDAKKLVIESINQRYEGEQR